MKRVTASRSLGPRVTAQITPTPRPTVRTAPTATARRTRTCRGAVRCGGIPAGRYWVGSRRLTRIDWVIVAFTVVLATIGWRQGFVAGALALVGFAAGAFAGSRIGPALLPHGNASPYAPLVSLVCGVAGGSILAGMLE